ncbi:MAG: aminotransferase class V-fold PLP-dependent enzyme [Synechococcus sp. ELA057]
MTLPSLERYLDASATAPPAEAVLEAMARADQVAWANPSSLHPWGLAAAELLERSRWRLATGLGTAPEQLILCSGGSEAIHLALLGSAALLQPGRLLISAVEHPATEAAAAQLVRSGWQLERIPVDRQGCVDPSDLARRLDPPTRLVSILWGQNEVGTLQPIDTIGRLCRSAGVRLHVDAVQVLGHRPIDLATLPIDLLSCTAHKLQGPRGVGALALAEGIRIAPLIGGGGQEGGRRGGTESVVLAHGFATALDLALARLGAQGLDPLSERRDALWQQLQTIPGVRLSGADPLLAGGRLPHHLSLLISSRAERPLSGRALVRALARRGWGLSSGSACSAGSATAMPSPVLMAMGYETAEAASGLRISLGPWVSEQSLRDFPQALQEAIEECSIQAMEPAL